MPLTSSNLCTREQLTCVPRSSTTVVFTKNVTNTLFSTKKILVKDGPWSMVSEHQDCFVFVTFITDTWTIIRAYNKIVACVFSEMGGGGGGGVHSSSTSDTKAEDHHSPIHKMSRQSCWDWLYGRHALLPRLQPCDLSPPRGKHSTECTSLRCLGLPTHPRWTRIHRITFLL